MRVLTAIFVLVVLVGLVLADDAPVRAPDADPAMAQRIAAAKARLEAKKTAATQAVVADDPNGVTRGRTGTRTAKPVAAKSSTAPPDPNVTLLAGKFVDLASIRAHAKDNNELRDKVAEVKFPVRAGLFAREVAEGGPADKAGIKESDIIVSIAGIPTPTSEALDRLPAQLSLRAGQRCKVVFWRFGESGWKPMNTMVVAELAEGTPVAGKRPDLERDLAESTTRVADLKAQNERNLTPLMRAALSNPNADAIASLIKAGADVNGVGEYGMTALMCAALGNPNPDVIVALAKAGADVNAKEKLGQTPLMYAALSDPSIYFSMPRAVRKDSDIIAALIRAGADVNAKANGGETSLMDAALSNPNPDVVEALLKAGADVNGATGSGMTPLMCAAMSNPNPDVTAVLIKAGADVNAKDKDGNAALDIARLSKHSRSLTLLIKAGATGK